MTDRKLSQYAEDHPEVKLLLESLTRPIDSAEYRAVMETLGHHLARGVLKAGNPLEGKDVCVVCTVEDADFLARGLIRELESEGFGKSIHLQCSWNDKVKGEGFSLSPIAKQYVEPFDVKRTVYIIVKPSRAPV